MGEIIHLSAYLKRQKYLKYLTEGIELNLDYQMLEEFKYHLERFLLTKGFCVLNDLSEDTMQILYANQDVMFLVFDGSEMNFTVPNSSDPDNDDQMALLQKACLNTLDFWEAFEKEIPFIQQKFI